MPGINQVPNGIIDASTVDTTFAPSSGIPNTLGLLFTPLEHSLALLPDASGRFLVAGTEQDPATGSPWNLVVQRFSADGSADASFGNASAVSIPTNGDTFRRILTQPDGKILLIGYTAGSATTTHALLLRLNADGSPDATFGVNGRAVFSDVPSAVNDAALSADGKIVAVGFDPAILGQNPAHSTTGAAPAVAIRLNPDGSPDSSFGPARAGYLHTPALDEIRSVAIDPAGKIVLGGYRYAAVTATHPGPTDSLVQRLTSDGSPDASFIYIMPPSADVGSAESLALAVDGKVLVGGTTLRRLNPDGFIDSSFGTLGTVPGLIADASSRVPDLLVQADGKILFPVIAASSARSAVYRLTPDGQLDPAFTPVAFNGNPATPVSYSPFPTYTPANGSTRTVTDIAVQPDGHVLTLGAASVPTGPSPVPDQLRVVRFYGTDPTPPAATWPGDPAPPALGAITYTFNVRYTDDRAIATASLGNDISVTFPDGSVHDAIFTAAQPAAGPDVTVSYRMDAPGGAMEWSDNGTYSVSVKPSAVTDRSNNPVPAGVIGSFTIDFAGAAVFPPADPAGPVITTQSGVLTNGGTLTPLVGWTVFDDANNNALPDPGERSAATDILGQFDLPLSFGVHTVRVLDGPGWTAAGGDAQPVTVSGSSIPPVITRSPAMVNPTVVDVLALYTPEANDALDGNPWSDIQTMFRSANGYFASSDTNVVMHVKLIQPVGYDDSGDLNTDLANLAAHKGALGAVPSFRASTGADLVVLFTSQISTTAQDAGQEIGVGYRFDPALGSKNLPFSVVSVEQVRPSNSPPLLLTDDAITLAHELGHNFGAGHDAPNEPAPITPYAHGYVFSAESQRYHDIMAYGPGTTLPVFSNPALTYADHAVGDPNTADDARVIRENAPTVASHNGGGANHSPAVTPPGNPDSVTIALAPAKPLSPGKPAPITATLLNPTGKPISAPATVHFYLSTDPNPSEDDTILTSAPVKLKLKPHGAKSVKAKPRLNATTTPGDYYLIAVIDSSPALAARQPVQVLPAPPKHHRP